MPLRTHSKHHLLAACASFALLTALGACVTPEAPPPSAPRDAPGGDRDKDDGDRDKDDGDRDKDDDRDEPEKKLDPVSDEVRAFEREAGRPFRDCGEIKRTIFSENCPEKASAEVVCMNDAIVACDPAKLRYTQVTIEGDPIYEDYFVTADCSLVSFRDTRFDEFGKNEVRQSSCEGRLEPEVIGENKCVRLNASGGCS